MSTIFDFLTVAIFLGIVVLFFHFSKDEDQDILAYIWPSVGCAMGNYFGNKDFEFIGALFVLLTLVYTYWFLYRPGGVPDKPL